MNKCELEIDAIRINLYEEKKHLTQDERIKTVNDKAKKLAEQYGFNFIHNTKKFRLEAVGN